MTDNTIPKLTWSYAQAPTSCCKCGKIIRSGTRLGREGELAYCWHCGWSYDWKVDKFQSHLDACSQCSSPSLCPKGTMLLGKVEENRGKQ